ncbi:restriction endonuclease subunit S [Flavobacterium hercynium]|uniref:Type I restriction modification DNA specificity domain-containing protein n=1 Tax=Flavobacterium hercynium TaxID=387094 RepID=A0A226HHZ5_9FLAO|nr:restriction endonuclease subunit S [Flavobacterium hercynium]OXA93785.1 hypothetical protein B0A66_05920 [Flavobacterium hercynium]SMP20386.1 type I restriction enzyme, S subunit [Flavobacterium hercynium]
MKGYKETKIGKIPEDWEEGKFSTDLKIQGRIGWKGYTTSDLVESGPIVIGGTEIKSKLQLVLENVKHLSRLKYEESPEIMLKDGDVLLVTRGNLGEVGYYHSEYGEATINPSVIILKEFIGNPKFLFYYLISKNGNQQVLSLTSGSSIPAIYQSEVYKLYYPKPNIREQKEIVDLIVAFDNKIELLRAQNKTLEETAQIIFKEWFGKYQITDKLPEGWRIGKLGDVTKTFGGTTPSTINPDYWNGDISWTSPKDLSNSKGIFLLNTEKKITKEGLKKISSGLLPKRTLLMSSRAPVGYLALTNIKLAINQGYIAIAPEQYFSNNFMYLWLKENMKIIENASNGSTFMEISKSSFRNIDCVIPNKKILEKFDNSIYPMFEKVLTNLLQIETLTKTRDELLPRLMSGEIRVKI